MRIAVAMSGGVDSSVAALLLREQGHEVVGLTMRIAGAASGSDAARVARRLGAEYHLLDAEAVFEERVIAPFVDAYRNGTTPNPCAACNRTLKFGWLLEQARALGCEALATGHYARLETAAGDRRLLRACDRQKDQSYFLSALDQTALEAVRFPLGELEKTEVRRLAGQVGLPVAEKPDSQDACFIPPGGLEGFLRGRGLGGPGEIVDREGRVLGRHPGVHAFTVGQRKGLGVAAGHPLYVVRKEARTNRLVVGPRNALSGGGLVARDPVWHGGGEGVLDEEVRCTVKIRSTARDVPCRVRRRGDRIRVRFEEPQFGVAPGQLAAFYRMDRVLGAAWIEAPLPASEQAECG